MDLRTQLNLVFHDGAVEELWELADVYHPTTVETSTFPSQRGSNAHHQLSTAKREREPAWKQQLSLLTNTVRASLGVESDRWPPGREIFYLIDQQSSRLSNKLIVDIGYRERLMKGGWGKIKSQNIQLNRLCTKSGF